VTKAERLQMEAEKMQREKMAAQLANKPAGVPYTTTMM